MALTIAVHTPRIRIAADGLREAARRYDQTFEESFVAWAESTADAMREEIPKDTHETSESVTVKYGSRGNRRTAAIGPTNRDAKGKPVGFFLNYGAAGRTPANFIGATDERARDIDFEIGFVL